VPAPDAQGVALTRWSLPRLADHLAELGLQVSAAHLGRVLAEAGLSFQRTRTWKASPDPDYETKAARVLELRAAPPADGGHVIACDQMGPLSLRPMAGPAGHRRAGPRANARPSIAATALATSSAPTTSTTTASGCGSGPVGAAATPRLHDADPRHDPRPPTHPLDPGQLVGHLGRPRSAPRPPATGSNSSRPRPTPAI
jgi:hypothetical protein